VIVAFAASPSERVWMIRHFIDVLLSDDVIDVVDEIGKGPLREMAVLTALARSLSN
jgi:hypothetical protein